MNNNTPVIRFVSYKTAWNECKLSDVVKLFGGNAFKSDDASSDGIPWLKIANVGKSKIDWSTESYLPYNYWLDNINYRLYKGDYVMALTRPILDHTLKIAVVDKESLLNQRVAKLTFLTDSEYGYQLLQKRAVVDKIDNELAGTDPPNLGSRDLNNIRISVVSDEQEQFKIGLFFKQFDTIIDFHQHKLTLLKIRKKAFLQKMFPKQGELTPEIRFSNYHENWEKLKLKEFVNYNNSKYSSNQFSKESQEGEYPLFDANKLIANINQYDMEDEYISIIKDGAGVGRLTMRPQKSSVIGTMGYLFSNMSDINFLFALLQNINFTKYIVGSTIPHIYYKDYGNITMLVPSIEEQTQIGNYFKQLEKSINLQEQKLESIKQMKKAFLQKMFV